MNAVIGIQHGSTLYIPSVEDGISLEWERKGSPGKLTFKVVADAALSFEEGDMVNLQVDDTYMFSGFVFSKSRKGNEPWLIDVVAYDQLRYFKNKDTYIYTGKTAAEVVQMLAEDFGLKPGVLDDTVHIIPTRTEDNVTLFDIIQNALDETFSATGKMFVLYDDFGNITLRDIESMKVGIMIDAETCGNYDYCSSIDDMTYNQIKVTYENKETGVRDVCTVSDRESIHKWGTLQMTEKSETPADAKIKADALLNLYNQKTRSLSVNDALGNVQVRGGSMVYAQLGLGDVSIQSFLLVEQVKHSFKNNEHLMTLKLRGGNIVT